MVTNPPAFDPATQAKTTSVLLVLTPFEENAKRIESHLLNAGHKVRTVWLSDLSTAESELQRGSFDLLIAPLHSEQMPLQKVIEACRRFAPTLPVLALAQQLSGEGTVEAVRSGARDLIADGGPEGLGHLERVFLREMANHRNQRELARARALLADYESRYTHLLEGTGDAVAHVCEGIVSEVNPAFANLIGYEDDTELVALPVMDLVFGEDTPLVRDHIKRVSRGDADGQLLDCRLAGKDGTAVPVSVQMTRGESEGEQFIEFLIRADAAGAATATTGSLSGRSDFLAALDRAGTSETPTAGLFIAIDRYHEFEERVGLIDSENISGQLGQALGKLLGGRDQTFAVSHGEFGAVLTRKDAADFEQVGAELVDKIAGQEFVSGDSELQLTVSCTIYPIGDGESADKVLNVLAQESRDLSDGGGNRFALIGPTAKANEAEQADSRKVEMIRSAIEDNRLKLAYQTIASLEGDSRQHFDVLVRLINDEGVELHASDFIVAAETNGLMGAIDRWVVEQAIRTVASRKNRNEGAMLFLKLSEDTLKDAEAFLAWVRELVTEHQITGKEVCFEVREKIAETHIRKAKLILTGLRELGLGGALEHFGVGSSSARMIEHLPLSYLKFHSSFTHKFNEEATQKQMTGLMEAAKQKRIKTIVSHVEDANVMARMWQMGVNYIQGYHVQEPEVVNIS